MRGAHTMKKLTAVVTISFMAGMIGGGIGARVVNEVWVPKTAVAAENEFTQESCGTLNKVLSKNSKQITPFIRVFAEVIVNEHCG